MPACDLVSQSQWSSSISVLLLLFYDYGMGTSVLSFKIGFTCVVKRVSWEDNKIHLCTTKEESILGMITFTVAIFLSTKLVLLTSTLVPIHFLSLILIMDFHGHFSRQKTATYVEFDATQQLHLVQKAIHSNRKNLLLKFYKLSSKLKTKYRSFVPISLPIVTLLC